MRNSKFKINNLKEKGYTLIELVVVIGLSAILLISAVSLFFTTFIGGGKTASLEYTKQAGGQALAQMTFLIRNSRKIIQNSSGTTCGSPMSTLKVENLDGGTTEFAVVTNGTTSQIASQSGGLNSFLTPSEVSVSNFTFTCSPVSYASNTWDGSPPIVGISFTLQKGAGGLARDLVSIPFSTSITLRNY